MYRVLLVDDEPLVLDGLRSLVDWASNGFVVCGEAADGEDALELMARLSPDVVVTDIRMPVVDGLELIRQAREKLRSPAKFVILSSYAEFAYAKEAMKHRVKHYLLKPIDEQEIEQALVGIKEEWELERQPPIGEEDLLRHAFAELLHGDFRTDDRDKARALLGESVRELRYALLEFPPVPSGNGKSRGTGENARQARRAAVERKLGEGGIVGFRCEEGEDQIGMLLIGRAGGPGGEPVDLREWAAGCRRALAGCGASLFLSDGAADLAELPALYRQAHGMRAATFLEPAGGFHDRADTTRDRGGIRLYEEADPLIRALLADDRAAVEERVRRVIGHIRRERVAPDVAYAFLSHLQMAYRKQAMEPGADAADDPIGLPLPMERSRPVLAGYAESLRRWCEQAASAARSREGRCHVIREALEYIHAHYSEKLRIRTLADRLHINPVYLGQLFKKQTGLLFGDYVHNVRIEEAKKLLRRTDLKIADVAGRVGYSDPETFVRKFKALARCLPSAYKNGIFRAGGGGR